MLTDMYLELEKQIEKLEEAAPIKTIGKERHGHVEVSSWSLVIRELIFEQLVNGTPLNLVNDNIKAFVFKLSPTTKIRELPIIWTIWRARLVLLVIFQTLSGYHTYKVNKWEQLFTGATSWIQVTFQNLVIYFEEDNI